MAYTDLTLLVAARTGLSIADAALTDAVAGGHKFTNDGSTLFFAQNTNGSSRTLTITTFSTVDGLAVADLTITLAATTGRILTATFPRSIYNGTDFKVAVDYSATSGVKVAAIRLPKELTQ